MHFRPTGRAKSEATHKARAGRLRWVGFVVLGSLLSLLLFAGVMIYQLSRSTVHFSLVRDRIESALQARLPPGYMVSVENASLAFRREIGLLIEAENVAIDLPGEGSISAASIATATPLGALFGGSLEGR